MSEPIPDMTGWSLEKKIQWAERNVGLTIERGTFYPQGEGPVFRVAEVDPPMKQIAVRLPVPLLNTVDELYGETKGGRSAFIRVAMEEKLARDGGVSA